jgi:beta-glucosidase
LSYSTFNYSGLTAPASVIRGKNITITAIVKNTGKKDGEEVVQLYISYPGIKEKAPLKMLKGFKRISLKAGESKKISFTITPEQLSLVNEEGISYQTAGKLSISVGGGQPGVKNKTTSNVVTKQVTIQ